MRLAVRKFLETGPDRTLSPEYWLSAETAKGISGAKKLHEVAFAVSKQSIPPTGTRYVLDTGNARDGLLDFPVLGDPTSARTSAKKLVQEGDVIVSRLRPYLRQVALLPPGISAMLKQQDFYCSTEFLVFRRRDGLNAGGLVAWLLSEPVQEMMSEAATGGHHPRINAELLLDARIEEKYLDPEYGLALSDILASHIKGVCELAVLLRH
ncbi:hypothetical protein GVN21_19295 [Caulobacter sp. SLTY]|uniref:hypothetical protein n=1 Tax=Caulobacter sp. SLTY TaxID=2683262 RepID=UPI001412B4DF|nr:hypothetical protein [Caulobacter sp. SLTY]NBB17512.1 hypothetical protein [Caulobacter sp. SLTY]